MAHDPHSWTYWTADGQRQTAKSSPARHTKLSRQFGCCVVGADVRLNEFSLPLRTTDRLNETTRRAEISAGSPVFLDCAQGAPSFFWRTVNTTKPGELHRLPPSQSNPAIWSNTCSTSSFTFMWGQTDLAPHRLIQVLARDRLPSHSRPQICRHAKPTVFPGHRAGGAAARGLFNVRTFHRQSDLGRTRRTLSANDGRPAAHASGPEIQRALGEPATKSPLRAVVCQTVRTNSQARSKNG